MSGLVDDIGRQDPSVREARRSREQRRLRPVGAAVAGDGRTQRERVGVSYWGNEVGLHIKEVEQPGGHEGHQSGGYCGHCSADENAGGGTEGKSEGGVADGNDVALVKRGEDGHVHPVNRAEPPCHHQAEEPGNDQAGDADDAQLHGQPAGAGDALSPCQAVGAGL